MRFLSRATAVVIAAGFVVIAAAPVASAAETAASDLVIIDVGDVIVDDLYAAGSRVIIDGTLDGDLVAFAGEEVLIRGEVTGSVTIVAPEVVVQGVVGGSVRVAASSLAISGFVGRDVVTTSMSVDLADTSTVTNDVVLYAFGAKAHGDIGGTLSGTIRSLELAGSVSGDVDVTVGSLSIVGPLSVAGDLGYRSNAGAEGLEQADVGGAIVKKTPVPPNIRVRALSLLAQVLIAMLLIGVALLVAWGWPEATERAGQVAGQSFLKAYGWGLLIFTSPLLVAIGVAILVAVTPAAIWLPLLAILAPVILALLGIVLALSLVAGVPAVLWLGRILPGERGLYGGVLLGSLIAAVVWMVPFVGWIVPLVALPLGLGSWLISRRSGSGGSEEPAEEAEAVT